MLGPCPAELLADKDLMLKALEFNGYAVDSWKILEDLKRDSASSTP